MANLTTSRQFNGRIISRWSCGLCAMLRSGTLCSVLSGSVKAVLAHEEKDGMLSCLTVSSRQHHSQGGLRFFALSKAFPPAVSLLSASVPSPLYCAAMALPVASINVLSSLRTVSISYDLVPLRDPIFWILAPTWKCWHCDLRGNWSSAKLCSKTTDFRWNWNSNAFGLTRSQSCI